MPYGSVDAYKKQHGKKPPSGSVGKGGGGGGGGGVSSGAAAVAKGIRAGATSSAAAPTSAGTSTAGGSGKSKAPRAPKTPSAYLPTKIKTPTEKYQSLTADYTAKDQRQIAARKYKSTATDAAVRQNYKIDAEGQPVTKKQRVPVPKKGVSPAQISRTMARFDQKIAKIKPNVSKKDYGKAKRTLTAIALRKLYKTDEKGRLLTEKKRLPVLKTSPEALQHDLDKVARGARKIRKAKGTPYGYGKNQPDEPVAELKTNLVKPTPSPESIADAVVTDLQKQGALPTEPAATAYNAIASNLDKGITFTFSQLGRLGAGTRSAVGKTLAGEYDKYGIHPPEILRLEGKGAEHVREAPGPLKSFLQSDQNDPNLVWGSDISEGLGLPRQTGIGFDLALDPLWFGPGFGAKLATIDTKLARKVAAVERQAPDILKHPSYARRANTAARTGDLKPLDDYLTKAANARGVKFPRIAPTVRKVDGRRLPRVALNKDKLRAEEIVKNQMSKENAELLAKLKTAVDRAPEINGRKVVLPGDLGAEATGAAVRSQLRKHQIAPGFRIKATTPFGRELGSIPVGGEWMRKLPLPTGGGRLGRFSAARDELADVRGTAHITAAETPKLDAELNQLKELRDAAKADGNKALFNDLEAQITNKIDEINALRVDAEARAHQPGLRGVSRVETYGDLVDRLNARHAVHEGGRMSSNISRVMSQDSQKNLADIISPIFDDEAAKSKVWLYQQAKTDRGDTRLLEETIGPLTPTEAKIVDDLGTFMKEVGIHGKTAGTLNNMIDNYATRIVHHGPVGTHPGDNPVRAASDSLGGQMSGDIYASRHRTAPEMASLADQNKLAAELRIANPRLTRQEALAAADKWYKSGTVRANLELLARRVQREGEIPVDELTEAQKQALSWGSIKKDEDDPLLKIRSGGVNEAGEEVAPAVVLGPGAKKQGFDPGDEVYDDLPVSAKISDAEADLEYVKNILKDMDPASDIAKQWKKIGRQYRAEIKRLKADAPHAEAAPARKAAANARAGLKEAKQNLREIEGRLKSLDDEIASAADNGGATGTLEWEKMRQGHWEIPHEDGRIVLRKQDGRGWDISRTDSEGKWYPFTDPQPTLKDAQAAVERKLGSDGSDGSGQLQAARAFLEEERAAAQRSISAYRGAVTRATRRNQRLEQEMVVPEHMVGRGRKDPKDYGGRLRDTREHGLFYETDPLRSNFQRTQVEALKTAVYARYRGLDQGFGMDVAEAEGKVGTLADGSQVMRGDVSRVWDKGEWVGWKNNETNQIYTRDEIDWGGLVPTAYKPSSDAKTQIAEIWADPHTSREYMRPVDYDSGTFGQAIQEAIGPDRVWPTDIMTEAKIDWYKQAGQGGGAYSAMFDQGMENIVQRIMQTYRYTVTTPWPAYHIRNMGSDVVKSIQADAGVMLHPLGNARLLALAAGRGKFSKGMWKLNGFPEMSSEELLLMFDVFGIRSTQHLSEFMHLAQTGKLPGKLRRSRLNPGPHGKWGKNMIEWGARREDIVRFQTFMQRMRRNGGDVGDAAWYMIQHHFDYSDLGAAQRRVARSVFLFYTWYRRNIPLQLLELARRPYFFSSIGNVYHELEMGGTPLNQDWSKLNHRLPDMTGPAKMRDLVPEYMQKALGGITLPWNDSTASVAFNPPWNDLQLPANMISDPFGQGLASGAQLMNPFITMGYQLRSGKELITNRDFESTEQIPGAYKWIADILGIPVSTGENGEPRIPWQLSVIMRNMPYLGRGASYLMPPSLDEADDTGWVARNKGALSYGLGLNMTMSPNTQDIDRSTEYKAKVYSDLVAQHYSPHSFENASLSPEEKRAAKHDARHELQDAAAEKHIPRWIQIADPQSPEYIPRRSGPSTEVGPSGSSSPSLGGSSDGKLRLDSPDLPTLGESSSSLPTLGTGSTENQISPNRKEGSREIRIPTGLRDEAAPSWEIPGPKGLAHSIVQAVKSPTGKELPRHELTQREIDSYATNTERPMDGGRAQLASTQQEPAVAPKAVKRIATKLSNAAAKSVQAEGMTPEQNTFIASFARESGLSPQLAAAAVLREGGNGTPGDNNWLNIGWTDSGPVEITRAPEWRDPAAAGKATAQWLRGEFGDKYGYVASDGIQNIGRVAASGGSDQEVGQAWANSKWASSGASPLDTLGQVNVSVKGIPKKVQARAEAALGKAATKAILNGGTIVKAPKGGGKQHKLSTAELLDEGDHIHFASEDPISMMLVVKHAQDIGLLQKAPGKALAPAGENLAYDTIDAPEHLDANESYHNWNSTMPNTPFAKRLKRQTGASGGKMGQAIDMAGDPELMQEMKSWIEQHTGKNVSAAPDLVDIPGTDLAVKMPASAPAPIDTSSGSYGGTPAAPTAPTGGGGSYGLASTGGAMDSFMRSPRDIQREMELEAYTPTEVAAALQDRVAGTTADTAYGLDVPIASSPDYQQQVADLEALIERLREDEAALV